MTGYSVTVTVGEETITETDVLTNEMLSKIVKLTDLSAVYAGLGTIIYEPAPYVKTAVEKLNASGDKNVYYYAFGKNENEPIGADGHPSSVTHARMANELETQIRKIWGTGDGSKPLKKSSKAEENVV